MKKFTSFTAVLLILLFLDSCKKVSIPEIATTDVIEISFTRARSGGEIINSGGAGIVSKGLCWSTVGSPTIADNKTVETTELEIFSSIMNQLIPNTSYYVRAYATNSAGTGYGNEVSFTTREEQVPLLTTAEPQEITQSTAKLTGKILDENGSSIVSVGICWNTSPEPKITNNKVSAENKTYGFESVISGLHGGTTYYVRAYATNATGTGYGNEIIFKTNPATRPVVETNLCYSLTDHSFKTSGLIKNTGGAEVTKCGICWNTDPEMIDLSKMTIVGLNSDNSFLSDITGLQSGTLYYVRAYAYNELGIAFGDVKLVKTYAVMDIDGNGYNSVTLGTQTWLKENLKTTKYRNGDPIPTTTQKLSDQSINPKYQWDNNVYGRLYTFYAITDSRNLCPDGWHVPSVQEWEKFLSWLKNNGYECGIYTYTDWYCVAKALADTILWLRSNRNGVIGNTDFPQFRNKTGFSGLPSGYWISSFPGNYFPTQEANWATTNVDLQGYAVVYYMYYDYNNISKSNRSKYDGVSVRCVKNTM
jgi:uncharacterized protein (TIGR02145 family)